jgi:hypothetical protein
MRTQCLECMRNGRGLAPSRRIDFVWFCSGGMVILSCLNSETCQRRWVLVSGLRVETVTKNTTSDSIWLLHCCTGQFLPVWTTNYCRINSAQNVMKLAIVSDTLLY